MREHSRAARKDPSRARYLYESKLKHRYGITLEDVARALEAQDHKCAICRRKLSDAPRGMMIDHDHTDGHFRGLLCFQCNIALGLAFDSPERLEAMARYLRADALVNRHGPG
jgi:hypothetical protein